MCTFDPASLSDMPNVPTQSPRKKRGPPSRRSGKSSKAGGSGSSYFSRAIAFHGSFQESQKGLTAEKLGIPSGTPLCVRRIDLTVVGDATDFVSLQINDASTVQQNDAIWGPLSKTYMVNPGEKTKIAFNNPSPTILWGVDSGDSLFVIRSTREKTPANKLFLTVNGVVTVATGNLASHDVSK